MTLIILNGNAEASDIPLYIALRLVREGRARYAPTRRSIIKKRE